MDDLSYVAGQNAARKGWNINNSYPYVHRDFVAGYQSVKPESKEDVMMKVLAKSMAPDEYKDVDVSREEAEYFFENKKEF